MDDAPERWQIHRTSSSRREPMPAKAAFFGIVCVTPLPAGIRLPGPEVLDVTWRRQGRRHSFACIWDGHGNGWAWVGGSLVA